MNGLERELRALGGEVAFPDAPDVAPRVRARLESAPSGRRPGMARRPLAVAIAAAALALVAALAVPQARSALADLFRLGGARIERVETLPATQPNGRFAPGRPVSLADARARAGFPLRTPVDCAHCDTVLYDATIPDGRVTIVWPGRRPRLFLMQFRGEATPLVEKLAAPDTEIRPVDVDGAPAYWVAGSPHAVVFRDARGRILFGRRLASNVLLWERDGVTFRLEGDVPLDRALAIARSVR